MPTVLFLEFGLVRRNRRAPEVYLGEGPKSLIGSE